MNKDSGKCAQCGQLNSTMASRCHSCYATLPWVKPAKVEVAKAPKAAAVKQATSSVDFGGWFQAAGGSTLTFLFCAAAPMLGFFLWKYMDKEGSAYTGPALIGWVLGIVFHVGRFGWKAVQVGSSLN